MVPLPALSLASTASLRAAYGAVRYTGALKLSATAAGGVAGA